MNTTPRPAHHRASWVPIRALGPAHAAAIEQHLLGLEPHDRYLRFGHPISDGQIAQYVDALDFERDELAGIFNRRLELIALSHLAFADRDRAAHPAMAEFGVSVLAAARHRGYGARLFEHAVMHARNRGTQRLFIHALSENVAMLKIARRAGAEVERDGSESEAWLRLPADTMASHIEQRVHTQASEMNYQFKRHAIRIARLLAAVDALRKRLAARGAPALD